MADALAKRLIARWEKLRDKRGLFEDHWQDVADHEAARRDFTLKKRTPGDRRMTHIYDTTALHSGGLLASGFHGMLTVGRWFRLATEDPRLMQDVDVRFWLEDAETQLLNVFTSPRRGFVSQTHETWIDEVWFGNAGMFIDDKPGMGAIFSARPLRELYWDEDEYGRVDTVFRKVRMSARNAVKKFRDKAGRAANEAFAKDQWEKEIPILHAIYPNDDRDPRSILPQRRMKYRSVFVIFDEQIVASESGYEELPIPTPRWEKDSDEVYGRGPGIFALPDAMMLNEMSRTLLTAAQKATNPPLMVEDDNVLSNVRIHPGGINVVRSDSLRENPIRPLPTDARAVGLGAEILAQRQAGVRQHFLPELLQLIRNTGDTPMTATQVVELSNRYMQIARPLMGRQEAELLGPIIDRTFAIEFRRGRFLQVPTLLQGARLKIEYQSPAARAQKQSDVDAIVATFAEAQQFAQTDPSVLHNLDLDEGIRRIAEFRGVPASVVVSMEDVLRRRAAEAEVARQESEMQQIQAASGVVKDMATAQKATAA